MLEIKGVPLLFIFHTYIYCCSKIHMAVKRIKFILEEGWKIGYTMNYWMVLHDYVPSWLINERCEHFKCLWYWLNLCWNKINQIKYIYRYIYRNLLTFSIGKSNSTKVFVEVFFMSKNYPKKNLFFNSPWDIVPCAVVIHMVEVL